MEYLVQIEWMKQNGYIEIAPEQPKFHSVEEATIAAKARWGRIFNKRPNPIKKQSNG